MRYLMTLLCFGLSLALQAAAAGLPQPVLQALHRAGIAPDGVGVVVQDTYTQRVLVRHNADQAMNPASVMKLLTTVAGLEILGPAYRWKTEVYLDGRLDNGVLQGNLVFKGYGDPKFTVEQFWLWLRELRQRGLREIRGDVVLDRSFFEPVEQDPAAFDGKPTRPYNVVPDALLLNFNAVHLHLIPDGAQTQALLEPELAGYRIDNHIGTAPLPCNGAENLEARLEQRTILLLGSIPAGCGPVGDYIAPLPHDEYFYAVFAALWKELGGSLQGRLRAGLAPTGREPFSTHFSQPLSELVRDINKYSNNVMARQLFLTLGSGNGMPGSVARSSMVLQQWLMQQHMEFPELVLENGAGLSRMGRITPLHLAMLLQHAASGPFAAELEASLPILGLDGTVKKRFRDSAIAGYAHLKTGTLDGVKSFAGYVRSKRGKLLAVVFMINHPAAGRGQAAQDALIEWVQQRY